MKSTLKAVGITLVLLVMGSVNSYSQNINMLSDTGNVGVGTTIPAAKLEVVGDTKLRGRLQIDSGVVVKDSVIINKKLTVDQDVKIKGESVFDGDGKFKSELKVLGTARMKEKLVVDSTANFNDKIVVDGLGKFNGDIKLSGDFIFGNNNRIGYLPASNGNPEIIGFGKGPNIGLGTPCTLPAINVPTVNQFGGMLQIWGYSNGNTTSGNINSLNVGYDGANGIIDMKGQQANGDDAKLLLNWYCGRDVAISTNPAKAGNVTMTSSTMGMVGIGKTPLYKLDVAGNVSINNHSLFLKDENHGLSQANSLPNVNISGDGPFLYGWGGGVLGINHGGTYTKVLNWNENGNVGIGIDVPLAKLDVNGTVKVRTVESSGEIAFAVNENVNGKDVFRVMSNGNVFATELTIKLKDDFPDYVFEKNYELMSLSELDHFIQNQKHLPNIPTAKDVEKNGLSVGEMQVKQMEKIEELTLYILELHKRIEELEKAKQ